ncbi:MAG: YafY family transcriptional regulator [Anaerolineae bacterium]|nr:YafY family transcriptional regulator [Anaerolineae bacterium]
MTHPASRLITLIMLMQSRPNQKAADLAKELGISVRSLHRYFEMLDEMGIPIYSERGPNGGFSLVRGYKMPPLVLTPEEAVAVSLGSGLVEEIWGSLYREAAHGALSKLDNLLPDEQRQEIIWARRSLVATGLHRSDMQALTPSLEKLRRAVREHRRLELVYQGGNQPAAESRRVDPYALAHRWGWWYLVAYCHLRHELRTFRVDRIKSLQLLAENFTLPPQFDIHSYLSTQWQDQPYLNVKLRFAPQIAHVALANRAYWEDLQEENNGGVLVTMHAPDEIWASSSALAYGPLVEVLEPDSVRKMVADWAKAISMLYAPQ